MTQNKSDWIFGVKRLIPAVVILLGMSSAGWAAETAPLRNLRAISALTNAEAGQARPVAFEATVTYFRGYENLLYVQDGDDAIYIHVAPNPTLVAGDRVLVKGTMQASFRPIVHASSVTVLHHGVPPKPVPATFEDLIRAEDDCKLVTVRAVVRAADLVVSHTVPPVPSARLQLVTEGGRFQA